MSADVTATAEWDKRLANAMMPKRAMYWNEDARGWYDMETDVAVKNMGSPEAEWSAKLAENAAHAAGEARQGMSNDIRASDPLYGTLSACQTCGHEIQYTKGFAQPGVWMHTDTSILYSHHIVAPIIENNMYIHPETGAATMEPNTHIAYLRDENKHLTMQLEQERSINADLMQRLGDMAATIRTLSRLHRENQL